MSGQVVHVGDVPDLDAPAMAGLPSVPIDRAGRYPDRKALRRLPDLIPWIDASPRAD